MRLTKNQKIGIGALFLAAATGGGLYLHERTATPSAPIKIPTEASAENKSQVPAEFLQTTELSAASSFTRPYVSDKSLRPYVTDKTKRPYVKDKTPHSGEITKIFEESEVHVTTDSGNSNIIHSENVFTGSNSDSTSTASYSGGGRWFGGFGGGFFGGGYYGGGDCCCDKPDKPDQPMNPVPEPASWAMMVAGAALAGAALRRQRAAALAPAMK